MAQQTFNDTKINVEFEPTSNRQQLASGDALPTLFGKISKTMGDLKPVAFSGDYNDLENIPSFVEGTNIAITKDEETNEVTIAADINKETLGLGNVDNTADANKNVKYATSAGSATKATQDASGNVITSTYAKASDLTSHTGNTNNPHSVTKAQVGLGNVPNVATNDQTPSYTVATSNTNLTSGEKLSVAFGKIAKAISSLISHLANTSNPHSVTKSQVGLGNVDNTSDANKPISTATQTALDKKANLASPTLTGTPKAPTATAGTNTTQIATTAFVQTAVANLVDSAPETLNTLGELATAIEEHQDVTDALDSAISNKVDKVSGKGLSTNDYTTNEKNKLSVTNVAYGTCLTEAATAAKVITISGNANWALKTGSTITVRFTNTNTASNPTFNVNNTGAKKVWYNTALITTTNLGFAGTANRPMNFVYDGTQYIFIGWSYDKDTNTTYSNASLGQGYGICATAESTVAKVVTLSSYALTTGGVVAVKFTYAVPANATMNINSKGAKNIYYRGAKITAGVIEAGDTATFIYNGTQYHLLTIDKSDASFKELSYADYQAGNYDKTKNYHIPDFPYTDGIASQISFDDSVAQTGTKNVQGAIESIEKSLIKNQNFGIDGMPVGKLLDGRTVYMAYGSQPITMTASESFEPYIIEHGITDIKHILSFELIMISGSTGYKLPYFTNGALHTVLTYINTESFCIDNRTSAWTDYTARYTMYYTKE